MRLKLLLQHECHCLWLAPGDRIACHSGHLWLTLEPCRPRGRSPDIVLAPGEQHAVRSPGRYFLSHLGEGAVEYEVAPAATLAASLRIQSATRSTSARGWRSASNSQNA